jgi:hypothetical protein
MPQPQREIITALRTSALRDVGEIALLFSVASSLEAQEFHPLTYAPAPVDNPLTGFAPFDPSGTNAVLHGR